MKTYRIFLASSVELDRDKELFEMFVSKKNKEWSKRGILFELLTWKDFVDAMSPTRRQDDYNEAIKKSDIFVVLFHTLLGKYTEEEFDTAYKAFKESGKPLIFTYFKVADKGEVEELNPGIEYFKDKIDKLGHFYSIYKNNDGLNYLFDQQLKKLYDEGKIPGEIVDWRKYRNYLLYFIFLPIIVLYFAYQYMIGFQPFNLTVTVREGRKIPEVPFDSGTVILQYAGKIEKQKITGEAEFKHIDGHYKNKPAQIVFEARGYQKVDTIVSLSNTLVLQINRDNSLGEILGRVIDEKNRPVAGATASVQDISVPTDANGMFRIQIPIEKQKEIQLVTVAKPGYRIDSSNGLVVSGNVIPFKLIKQ
jgi:hypothetical protein